MDTEIYLPENYRVFLLCDYNLWKNDFEKVRKEISLSNDSKKENYSHKRFKIEDQEEMTILYYKDKLVAFSSLFNGGPFKYPDSCYRSLNRSWKSPEIRWIKEPYWIISQKMLLPQIKKARKIKASAVFISTEGRRLRWMQRWVQGAKSHEKNWKINPGMTKVCDGSFLKCWQIVVFLQLNNVPNWEFPLPSISMKDWSKKIKEYS